MLKYIIRQNNERLKLIEEYGIKKLRQWGREKKERLEKISRGENPYKHLLV